MLFNTDKESMFFLINKKNEEIRRSENRMALRRAKRKLPKSDSLRILEGNTVAQALKAEEKALKAEATKKEAAKVKVAAKKVIKKVAEKKSATAKKTVKKESVEAGSKVPSKVEASEEISPTNELF